MKNPWEELELTNYENHMSSESVMQLQSMNTIMKEQFYEYSTKTIMILGIAGGNGLEHIDPQVIEKVIGIDINRDYLDICVERYPQLDGILNIFCTDLTKDEFVFPHADLVIANLLIEYIGYTCFQKIMKEVKAEYVSCVIQINENNSFVSDSPYLHFFKHLDSVHNQISETSLIKTMESIGYDRILNAETLLPNGKKLVRLDFKR